eukprot:5107979-Alexandrium_andersonii.AAC.1
MTSHTRNTQHAQAVVEISTATIMSTTCAMPCACGGATCTRSWHERVRHVTKAQHASCHVLVVVRACVVCA